MEKHSSFHSEEWNLFHDRQQGHLWLNSLKKHLKPPNYTELCVEPWPQPLLLCSARAVWLKQGLALKHAGRLKWAKRSLQAISSVSRYHTDLHKWICNPKYMLEHVSPTYLFMKRMEVLFNIRCFYTYMCIHGSFLLASIIYCLSSWIKYSGLNIKHPPGSDIISSGKTTAEAHSITIWLIL